MSAIKNIGSGIQKTNGFLYIIGGVIIGFVTFATLIDVTGRYFRHPLPGTLEMCQLALAGVVFLSLAHTQAGKGHVTIDLIFPYLPRVLQGVLKVVNAILGVGVAVIMAAVAIPYVTQTMEGSVTTDLLKIPLYPFQFLIFVGALCLLCQFMIELVKALRALGVHRGSKPVSDAAPVHYS